MNGGMATAGNKNNETNGLRRLSILALDDDRDHLFILETILRKVDTYDILVNAHTNPKDALESLHKAPVDVIMVDYDLRTTVATSLIHEMREAGFQQPILVLTGVGNEAIATKVMKSGASDYIVKSDLSPELLRVAIDGALHRQQLQREKLILQRELLESQKMEAVGTLVGGIAFDFNNLLTVVLSEVELALMQPKGTDVSKNLEQVQTTAYEMVGIVRRLVAFDQYTRETRSLGYLGLLVSDTCTYLRHILPRQIHLECDVAKPGIQMVIQKRIITKILINLALNAADALPEGGTITIRLTREEGASSSYGPLPEHLHADRIVLEVTDDGIGIPPEVRPRIFEPFFTTKDYTNRKGAGLGLSMVWQLVQSMRGHIQVSTTVGEGTTMRVCLPKDTTYQEQLGESLPEEARSHGDEHILLLDSDTAVRESVASILEELGYSVHPMKSGAEALKFAEIGGTKLDLLLMDLDLEDMAGTECAEKLKQRFPGMPILAVTANLSGVELGEYGETAFSADIIQRPLSVRDLGLLIRTQLDR